MVKLKANILLFILLTFIPLNHGLVVRDNLVKQQIILITPIFEWACILLNLNKKTLYSYTRYSWVDL